MTTSIKKPVSEAQDAVSELLHEAGDRFAELKAGFKDGFKDESLRTLGKRLGDLGSAMQQRPVLAIGLGIGLGYVLARLLHRD